MFTITVTNAGPEPAMSVEVTDLLPAELTLDSHAASAGTFTPATGVGTWGR